MCVSLNKKRASLTITEEVSMKRRKSLKKRPMLLRQKRNVTKKIMKKGARS